MKITKQQLIDFVRYKLSTDEVWIRRALIVIYNHQTADEQSSGSVDHFNNCGFTSCDSFILTSLAKQILNGSQLSEKQLNLLKKKMPKYSRQIINSSDIEKLKEFYLKENNHIS